MKARDFMSDIETEELSGQDTTEKYRYLSEREQNQEYANLLAFDAYLEQHEMSDF